MQLWIASICSEHVPVMLLVHCLASRVCQKLTFNTFPVVHELSAVMCPRGLGLGRGLSLKAKTKAKDFVIKAKAKAKATALCPRGASRTRPSPQGDITGWDTSVRWCRGSVRRYRTSVSLSSLITASIYVFLLHGAIIAATAAVNMTSQRFWHCWIWLHSSRQSLAIRSMNC